MKSLDYILGVMCGFILLLGLLNFYKQNMLFAEYKPLTVFNNQETTPPRHKITILGAVKNPGEVVVINHTPRIIDAVNLAGGLSKLANIDKINLAKGIENVKIISIPFTYENEPKIIYKNKRIKQIKQTSQNKTVTYKPEKNKKSLKYLTININTAPKSQLILLPGIGDKISDSIIKCRNENKFSCPEDLRKVKGIGKKRLAKIMPYIVF